MALSGTVNSSNYSGRYIQLTWSATQSIENNISTISWSLKGAGGSSTWYKSGGFYVEIDGNVVCNWSTNSRIELRNGTPIASGSLNLAHNSDGSKSFTISIKAGIYTYAQNCSGSGTFSLDTIARASQPSCITYPDNTQYVGDIGETFTIHMNRRANFTHTVRYAWYGTSGTIATNITNNCRWTIPLNFANTLPNSTSGWGTIYVDTYNGSTKIGTKSCRFDATVPAYMIPSVNSVSIDVDNSANSEIEKWGLYVVGYSKMKISATASGSYGSSISSFTISGTGYGASESGSSLFHTSNKFTSSGNKTFDIKAKDSRGRYSQSKATKAITVYAYNKPSISFLSVQRNPSNPQKIVVKADWTFSSVNGKNSATGFLYYKESTSKTWKLYGALPKNIDTSISYNFYEGSSYNFRLVVTDSVGNSAQIKSFLSTVDVLLDFRAGGKGIGIGKIAETDSMEVALDAKFMGEVYIYQKDGNAMTLENYIKSIIEAQ